MTGTEIKKELENREVCYVEIHGVCKRDVPGKVYF